MKAYIAQGARFLRGPGRNDREARMTFADTVRFLFSLGPELKTVKWDLARIRALLAELGNPASPRPLHPRGRHQRQGIHLRHDRSALRVSGFRTGLYTSPHLVDPARANSDRWRADLRSRRGARLSKQVHAAAEGLLARDEIDAHPSFFETVTAMAFLAFAQGRCRSRGARDRPRRTAGRDQRGRSRGRRDHARSISITRRFSAPASNPSRPKRPASSSRAGPRCSPRSARRRSRFWSVARWNSNVPVTLSSAWRIEDLEIDRFGSRFTLWRDEVIPIECPLAGEHQVENARTAVAALSIFGVSAAAISAGIARAKWPGRLERIAHEPGYHSGRRA